MPINNIMEFIVQNQSLSALRPVKFTYRYNSEDLFESNSGLYQSNFGVHQHELLNKFQDAAFSKQTCVILTDTKPLSTVFKNKIKTLSIGDISCSAYIKTINDQYLTIQDDNIFVGGTGERLLVTIVPTENGQVELYINNKETYIRIDEEYPYTAEIYNRPMDTALFYRKRFYIDYKNGFITFKTKTLNGYRYLSYGADKTLRAVGLEMNDAVINPYRFKVEFKTSSYIRHDFDPVIKEVKYFNEVSSYDGRKTLNIKASTNNDTNIIATCPTLDIALESLSSVNLNMAIAKTNFSAAGSYIPTI